jgi:hypothetical protein
MVSGLARFFLIIIMNKIISHCLTNKNNFIILNKCNKLFSRSNAHLCIDNKQLITISPGGIKGFYLLGILSFIKDNYNTDNLIYSGASAGSWNSLFMCYKGNSLDLIYNLLDINLINAKSIIDLEYYMKYKMLSKYKTEDFDLKKIYIGVTTISKFKFVTNIFSDFHNLEDAIDCCIASSHIPFITGGLTNKYNNMITFDGGLSENPYLNKKEILHIYPNIWKNKKQKKETLFEKIFNCIIDYSEFFSVKKNNPLKLFDDGYQDAKRNKIFLDKIFIE